MTTSRLIEITEQELNFLNDEGFKISRIDQNIWCEKITNEITFKISFAWNQYATVFSLYGTSISIRLNHVEDIIGIKSNYLVYTVWNKITLVKDRTDIEKDIDLIEFLNHIRKGYNTEIAPFFQKFSNIEKINDWLNTHDQSKHQELLTSDNNSSMLRKLVIMKECKDEGYSDLYWRYKTFLQNKANERESPYFDMWNEFERLIPYFEK